MAEMGSEGYIGTEKGLVGGKGGVRTEALGGVKSWSILEPIDSPFLSSFVLCIISFRLVDAGGVFGHHEVRGQCRVAVALRVASWGC